MNRKIVILGGGYGGVLTAKKLEKKLRKSKIKNIDISLIDKNPFHTMLTELHEVAAGRVDEESIKIDLKKIFAGRKVNVILDEIKDVDFENKRLKGNKDDYSYDYLVVASGSKPTDFCIKGVKDYAFSLWSYNDAVKIRHHILEMFRNASKEPDEEKRREMLTFIVAGAGYTGVEMVGELAEWAPILRDKFSVDKKDIRIILCDMLPEIMPSLPKKLIKKARRRLNRMGVDILTGESITEVSEDKAVMSKSGEIKTRTLIWNCGVEGSEIVKNMNIEKQGRDRIVLNEYLQSKENKDVYVVGDNMFYIPEGEESPVPQMVENCERSAPVVANNILSDITGKGNKIKYKPEFHGVMVSIGGRYGIAYIGSGKKKTMLPSFFAMIVKHLVNMYYFVQVAGWNKVYSYMQHEFFRIQNRRSIVGGYFSKRSPNFWLLPLRMFVGIKWLLQGIEKVPKVINDYYNIFIIPMSTDGGTGATDAATGATQAAGGAAAWGDALPLPGFLQDISEWVLRTFIEPIAPFFQASMVFMEVIVGLCLIAGLFTAPIATISVIMCIMIYMSGWAAPEILWYFMASIALIAGSGSTFGMDYYVLPMLKKLWRKIPFIKKWYLYND